MKENQTKEWKGKKYKKVLREEGSKELCPGCAFDGKLSECKASKNVLGPCEDPPKWFIFKDVTK